MWIVCITSVRHVLTVNGYGGRQTKENEKSWCFKGWETLGVYYSMKLFSNKVLLELCNIATKPVYHLMEYMYRYNMAFVSTFILPNYKNIGG